MDGKQKEREGTDKEVNSDPTCRGVGKAVHQNDRGPVPQSPPYAQRPDTPRGQATGDTPRGQAHPGHTQRPGTPRTHPEAMAMGDTPRGHGNGGHAQRPGKGDTPTAAGAWPSSRSEGKPSGHEAPAQPRINKLQTPHSSASEVPASSSQAALPVGPP
ncbi:brain acid soluble protein 1-like [Cervus canadensis]|uniref:brain acid soluble protein 1-like n=1 Tax=Cervus canadensis TaxID=1574408 RepID=UPI001CA301F2|nr:brain acid soluble protein 1-like [Cervus canadensis]